jgi:hypothetical protein
MHQRSSWHDLRWLHSVHPPQVHPNRLIRITPSKFDQDQLSVPSGLQFVMPDLLPVGVPNKPRRSRLVSPPQRHSILILINAADDRAPSIQQTTPVHVHGGQQCAHSTLFDGYSPRGSLARRGRGDPASPVATASAGSDAVCHPTTTVSTELSRSLAAQPRSDVGTCRSIERRLKSAAPAGSDARLPGATKMRSRELR